MPIDIDGYRYILLIDDLFSKYIEAVPLIDQNSSTIIKALYESWLSKHGYPQFLLTDQGSNVDGETMNNICREFHIEKRRTSGYHSQGNGFAERNIRSVKETLPQIMWKDLLASIIFALNTSKSSATKYTPYKIVYGRDPTFPIDIVMDTIPPGITAASPADYLTDLKIQMRDILLHVTTNLNISRTDMMKQYNKNVRFFDYKPGEKVWVKRRYFKPGENRKLAPRKSGPWTIVEKKPNGVNFKIQNEKQTKIIHHDRLVPYKVRAESNGKIEQLRQTSHPTPDVVVPTSNFIYSSDESDTSDSETGETVINGMDTFHGTLLIIVCDNNLGGEGCWHA